MICLREGGRMYTFLKWNSKYGAEAKFVVVNNETGRQSMFVPGRTQDLVWTASQLDKTPEIANWSDFGQETVEDLEEVAF